MIEDSGTTDLQRRVSCPGCGGPSLYAPANPFRPFCSARCQQNDLGAWASESFRMPEGPLADDADNHEA